MTTNLATCNLLLPICLTQKINTQLITKTNLNQPDILGSHFLSTRGASYGHEWLVHVDLVTASRCKWCLSHKRTTFTYNVFRLYSSSLLLCQVRDFSKSHLVTDSIMEKDIFGIEE